MQVYIAVLRHGEPFCLLSVNTDPPRSVSDVYLFMATSNSVDASHKIQERRLQADITYSALEHFLKSKALDVSVVE